MRKSNVIRARPLAVLASLQCAQFTGGAQEMTVSERFSAFQWADHRDPPFEMNRKSRPRCDNKEMEICLSVSSIWWNYQLALKYFKGLIANLVVRHFAQIHEKPNKRLRLELEDGRKERMTEENTSSFCRRWRLSRHYIPWRPIILSWSSHVLQWNALKYVNILSFCSSANRYKGTVCILVWSLYEWSFDVLGTNLPDADVLRTLFRVPIQFQDANEHVPAFALESIVCMCMHCKTRMGRGECKRWKSIKSPNLPSFFFISPSNFKANLI